jgi:hypothetical protein
MMSNEEQAPSRSGISGLVFVGCLLVALAIGIATAELAVALLAGLGVGFIGMGVVRLITGRW